jgi:hypothetical protein
MGLGLVVVVLGGALALGASRFVSAIYARLRPRRSLDEVLTAYAPNSEARMVPRFEACGVAYPPERVALLAFKAERSLELWARDAGAWRFVRAWPVLAASGGPGPKLREGDGQVPEGLYRVASLNPNSRFHLSLELDYPNALDRERAAAESRTPGGEIFIHGGERSIGCLAIGDEAIEELFVLAARVGAERIEVVIAPNDVRGGTDALDVAGAPAWYPELLASVRAALAPFEL